MSGGCAFIRSRADHHLKHVVAGAAVRPDAAALEVAEGAGAFVDGIDDIAVGFGFTEANDQGASPYTS
jgi:hypothetical protein